MIGPNGEQAGVVPVEEGVKMAKENDLDLVEVAPFASPPVCRVMDYSKYKYDQEKKEREARKKQRIVHIKEIKFGPKISENDYQVKLRYIKNFLTKGDKVKATLMYRGREMAHQEFGRKILNRLIGDISDVGEVEKEPLMEGRILIMVLRPK